MEEEALLQAIREGPRDSISRLVYADWLEERGDPRSEFVRTHLLLRALPPDHPSRRESEPLMSRLRRGIDPEWLAVIEPERRHLAGALSNRPRCGCFDLGQDGGEWAELELHGEAQDTECDAWKMLLDLVERAAAQRHTSFAPSHSLGPERWCQIVTLPATIAKLKSVRSIELPRGHLVRIPPEIGEMESLQNYDPYTSHLLHWHPFEIARCKALTTSLVSTRALYGNEKFRSPFPILKPYKFPPGIVPIAAERECSVCRQHFVDLGQHRVWISLRVGRDVLPLLVNACSEACIKALPQPAAGYVKEPHTGGLEVRQP